MFFFFPTIDHRLKNYIISSEDVYSPLDCGFACMEEERCRSYNIRIKGNPFHKCELNSNSRSSARTGSFERADGYNYYEEAVTSQVSYFPGPPGRTVIWLMELPWANKAYYYYLFSTIDTFQICKKISKFDRNALFQ